MGNASSTIDNGWKDTIVKPLNNQFDEISKAIKDGIRDNFSKVSDPLKQVFDPMIADVSNLKNKTEQAISISKEGFQKLNNLPDLLKSKFDESLQKTNADIQKSNSDISNNLRSQFGPLIDGLSDLKNKSENGFKKIEDLPSILKTEFTHVGDEIRNSLVAEFSPLLKGFDLIKNQGEDVISRITDIPNILNGKIDEMNRFFLNQFQYLSDNFNKTITDNLKMAIGKLEDGVTKVIPNELIKLGDETRHIADIVRNGLEEKVLPVLKEVVETGVKLITAPGKLLNALANMLQNPMMVPLALALGSLIVIK
jgi:hypothetical protein